MVQKNWKTRHVAAFIACTDVGELRALAPQFRNILSLSFTPNFFDTSFSFYPLRTRTLCTAIAPQGCTYCIFLLAFQRQFSALHRAALFWTCLIVEFSVFFILIVRYWFCLNAATILIHPRVLSSRQLKVMVTTFVLRWSTG